MAEETRETIVIFPFMAQGHMIPLLALALQIEQRGYDIVFVNTPLNIQKLRRSIPGTSAIMLREIPFSAAEHGLPDDAEITDVLPYPLVIRLLEASTSLRPAFHSLLTDLSPPPLCVVADIFFGWSADVAHELGVFHALFSVSGGFGLACYYSTWLHLPHRSTNSAEFTLPDFPEAGRFHVTQLAASFLQADGSDSWSLFHRKNLPAWANSDGVLFNSIAELDEIGFNYFRRKLNRPIWPIGPILLPADGRARSSKQPRIMPEECLEWLDSKPPNSVLYISFGSTNTISASQMIQLAKALDQITSINFIWVVRPPLGFDIAAEFRAEEWLPEGFTRRNQQEQRRGLIVEQWAPQVEILSHNSVGAFLTHCGWNSVMEALIRGIALIGWPMAAEQFFNAKFLAEAGVCVEVARGTSFEVRHLDIMEKIEIVMMGESEKGKEMRRKAMEIKEMIRDAIRDETGFKGSSVKAMEEFFRAAVLMKNETKLGMQ